MTVYALFCDTFFKQKPQWMPRKLYTVVCNRAHPRDQTYMIAYLHEQFPQAQLLNALPLPPDAEKVILLYPDAIGLGSSLMDVQAMNNIPVHIINGRRRSYHLTKKIWLQHLYRRFFAQTFLPELLLTPGLILLGSIWALKDKLLRRK